jgi:hypothetical protein
MASQLSAPFTTEVKTSLVLRLLAGESIASLARETGLPRRQLSVWHRRFLSGGEAYLDSRPNPREVETLESATGELSGKVAELELENERLNRRVMALGETRSGHRFAHPYCSLAYAEAQAEPNSESLAVPAWGTHLLVRVGSGGKRLAVGGRPFAAFDPNSDLQAGLDYLREAGVNSVSLVTDPMWSSEQLELEAAFDVCRRFKETYLVDRASGPVRISKRHRNRINNARLRTELREISFADHLDTWHELYRYNVVNRQIPQPFSDSYFERLATFPELRTFAVLADSEIVTITTWIRYRDTLYFHDSASNARGHALSASYVAFAHVVETFEECRYVFLGGAAEFVDDPLDGLARFKRGFSNRSTVAYLCSAILSPKPKTAGAAAAESH